MFDRRKAMSPPVYAEPQPTGDVDTDFINQVKAKRLHEQAVVEWEYRMENGGYIFTPYIPVMTVAQISESDIPPRMLLKSRYTISNVSFHSPNNKKV